VEPLCRFQQINTKTLRHVSSCPTSNWTECDGSNVLYDRVGTGEFFQFYTLPFEQRFFFEVVQRTGSYDLYGASNAPVRLAALAHHHASVSQIIP